jgi:hypothetical protein
VDNQNTAKNTVNFYVWVRRQATGVMNRHHPRLSLNARSPSAPFSIAMVARRWLA